MHRPITALAFLVLLAANSAAAAPSVPADIPGPVAVPPPAWARHLHAQFTAIDDALPGELGVYVENIHTGDSFSFHGDETWYMASVIKVPIAIQVLRDIQDGTLSLDTRIELLVDDFVDGAGETNLHPAGARLRVDFLLEQMLIHSDNTASDVLIRTVGLDRINATARELLAHDGEITTLADVRRYAYSGFHPRAAYLRSADLLAIRQAGFGESRITALAVAVGVPRSELLMQDLDTAFEAFYATRLNAAPISAYGRLLAATARGEVLDGPRTRWLLDVLGRVSTGQNRIRAGLPQGARFEHKTGTQHLRSCDVGIVTPPEPRGGQRTVVAACTRGVASLAASERALRAVGRAVGASGVLQLEPARHSGNPSSVPAGRWVTGLQQRVAQIDADMPGRLGVHIRRMDGERLDHGQERDWYLASTIKIPVAIAVLEQVEAGALSLEQTLTLQESDFVDGAGDLIWHEAGVEISLGELIGKSLRDSDSTATDMLIRLIGEAHLNRRVSEWVGGGFNDITTVLQVRYDLYGPAHPDVSALSNMDIVRLRNADAGEPRLQALAEALGVAREELKVEDFDTLFANYYARGHNSGRLEAFGTLLERLDRGELLDEYHTTLLLEHMLAITTGDRRIAAGLPEGVAFAQKTGTQIARACNVGIINPQRDDATLVVVACAEDFDHIGQAERAFQALGRAIGESLRLD
jgi:beta-lactamase class A